MRNYVEPFAGSLAVLLRCPHEGGIETVNDKDCYLANFWRAIAFDPAAVADAADWPVNEIDLHARHRWLVAQIDFRERMLTDPDYFDAKIAGWWAWGLSCWIGSGWCALGEKVGERRMPEVSNRPDVAARSPRGVHRSRPHTTANTAGHGVHRQMPRVHGMGGMGIHGHRIPEKMPRVHGKGGVGVAGVSIPEKRPRLGGNGGGMGVHGAGRYNALGPWFESLRDRLRRVRVVCGDFERICGPSVVLPASGFAGLFMDPPYPAEADRHKDIYSADDLEVAHRAHAVALEWGENPKVRVAFCGYAGTHAFPGDWEVVPWKAAGGYGGGMGGKGDANAERERIWFSPACLLPAKQLELL